MLMVRGGALGGARGGEQRTPNLFAGAPSIKCTFFYRMQTPAGVPVKPNLRAPVGDPGRPVAEPEHAGCRLVRDQP